MQPTLFGANRWWPLVLSDWDCRHHWVTANVGGWSVHEKTWSIIQETCESLNNQKKYIDEDE